MLKSKQIQALNAFKSGHSLYIGGQAGVGKTFLVKHIIDDATKRGKVAQLTCTTGIACSNYPQIMNAMTIHKWSGIGDGRYSGQKLKTLLCHDEQYAGAKARIMTTDILIIDEISMLSLAMYENLETICQTKCDSKVFGGMQMVVVGDFLQLPPVKNVRYSDLGQYAFESKYWPKHSIYLDEVIRQKNENLIQCIRDLSLGDIKPEHIALIRSLSRFLPHAPDQETVSLFSSNILVDMFNRDCILKIEGPLFTFDAIDTGKERYLKELVVQKIVWLKVNANVMLLRNLSSKLVNGLCGQVKNIKEETVTVYFPTIDTTANIKRISFTVYDPRTNRNIAERFQFPLKLSYARTVHKAQGMTLQRVQIDCRHFFQPGQLAVALGRVTSEEGLRVINFCPDAVIKQPLVVVDFLAKESASLSSDLLCCFIERNQLNLTNEEPFDTEMKGNQDEHPNTKERKLDQENRNTLENDIEKFHTDDESETELDKLVQLVTEDLESEIMGSVNTEDEIILPSNFDVEKEVLVLKYKSASTSFQKTFNALVDYLISNIGVLNRFCSSEWQVLSNCFEDNVSTSDITSSVAQPQLTLFYQKCQEHMTSPEYKTACLRLFDPSEENVNAEFSVCFNLMLSLRKVLLKSKTEKLEYQCTAMHKRAVNVHMSDTARGKVRYIGGYVIAKLRHSSVNNITNNLHKTSSAAIDLYERSKMRLEILDCIKQSEHSLNAFSEDSGSLLEISRKQNVNRSLTNISDLGYNFFLQAVNGCLTMLTGYNFSKYGSFLYEYIHKSLSKNTDLFRQFLELCEFKTSGIPEIENDICIISSLLDNLTLKVIVLEVLFDEILHKIVSVLTKQFTADTMTSLSLTKKMEHRKQIQVAEKSSRNLGVLNFQYIQEDQSLNKIASHCMLKAALSTEKTVLQKFTKNHLLLLCKAYNCSAKGKKNCIIDQLKQCIINEDHMLNPKALNPNTETDVTSVAPSTRDIEDESSQLEESVLDGLFQDYDSLDNVEMTSSNKHILPTVETVDQSACSIPATPTQTCFSEENEHSEDDVACSKCEQSHHNDDWISCDYCNKWYHRKCIGLRNVKKWKKVSRKGAKYCCPECK